MISRSLVTEAGTNVYILRRVTVYGTESLVVAQFESGFGGCRRLFQSGYIIRDQYPGRCPLARPPTSAEPFLLLAGLTCLRAVGAQGILSN